MLTRRAIINHLATALATSDDIRAAWVGGSDAFNRADELSDVDIFILVRPGRVDAAANHFQESVEQLSPISINLRLPMPTWHGFHQAFYQLQHAPEHLMVDWLAVEVGAKNPWTELERHGRPTILFDKDSALAPTHVDPAAIRAATTKRVDELRLRFPLFRHLATKQAHRALPADAASFYHNHVVKPLVDLLRCVHCPDRHDYALRYLKDDLPRADYETVCRLCYPRHPEDIESYTSRASALFDKTLALWDAKTQPSA